MAVRDLRGREGERDRGREGECVSERDKTLGKKRAERFFFWLVRSSPFVSNPPSFVLF